MFSEYQEVLESGMKVSEFVERLREEFATRDRVTLIPTAEQKEYLNKLSAVRRVIILRDREWTIIINRNYKIPQSVFTYFVAKGLLEKGRVEMDLNEDLDLGKVLLMYPGEYLENYENEPMVWQLDRRRPFNRLMLLIMNEDELKLSIVKNAGRYSERQPIGNKVLKI